MGRRPLADRGAAQPSSGHRPRLRLELLEPRCMFSASGLDSILASSSGLIMPDVTSTRPLGYTPAQISQAYGFDQILLTGNVKGNGSGQTIAIVDAYNDPNIASDLAAFDSSFGLAAPPKFTVVNQSGGTTKPPTDAGWSLEISLDVEWAHAMAPGANILLVEAANSSLTNLLAAVNYARNQATTSVISMSWGSAEFAGETAYDSYFTTPNGHSGETFVVSSGDNGAPASWPAASPNVLAVGGTALTLSGSTYSHETGWSGSGGGVSKYESEPSYQTPLQTTGKRTNPDVAYDASPSTGFAVYDTVSYSGQTGWFDVGGTSAGAPQWAALVAIADQGRALAGKAAISSGQVSIAALSSSDFHDITSGNNGYAAVSGYDLVTGRGSPIANFVVRDLVGTSTVTPPATKVTVIQTVVPIAYRIEGIDPGYSPVYLDLASTNEAPSATNLTASQGATGSSVSGVTSTLAVSTPATPVATWGLSVNSGRTTASSFALQLKASGRDEISVEATKSANHAAIDQELTRRVETTLDSLEALGSLEARSAELSDRNAYRNDAAANDSSSGDFSGREWSDTIGNPEASQLPVEASDAFFEHETWQDVDSLGSEATGPRETASAWELQLSIAAMAVTMVLTNEKRRDQARRLDGQDRPGNC
jgi:subtilase family serine protease